MRLLVVDDSNSVWERLLDMLGRRPEEIDLCHARNLQAARRCLGIFHPNWVVLDADLPDGTGLDLLPELRGQGFATHVAVFTNHPEYRLRSLELGADSFFDKSMDFLELVAMLRQHASIQAPIGEPTREPRP